MVLERFGAFFFAGRLLCLLWLFFSERLASTPGGREQRIGVVGSPCPMLR
jgi:hypothetical protein